MEAKNKMAVSGLCLIAGGIGLSVVGAVLIVPAAVGLTIKGVEKASETLSERVERASKTVGAVAGTLQRSFTEAVRAGRAR